MLTLLLVAVALDGKRQLVVRADGARADGARVAEAESARATDASGHSGAQRLAEQLVTRAEAGSRRGRAATSVEGFFNFKNGQVDFNGNGRTHRTPGVPTQAPRRIGNGSRRGLYVALDEESRTKAASHILGDREKEEQLLTFCFEHGINALTLLDLHQTLHPTDTLSGGQSVSRRAALRAFLRKARTFYGPDSIISVEAAIDHNPETWSRLAEYNAEARPDERFDGAVVEEKYWQVGAQDHRKLLSALSAAKDAEIPARVGRFRIAASLGVVPAADVGAVCGGVWRGEAVDEVWLEVYAEDPADLPARIQERRAACNGVGTARFVPILSAEGAAERRAGPRADVYEVLGDWLFDHMPDPMDQAEQQYYEHAAHDDRFQGYQWFSYEYARWYMQVGEGEDLLVSEGEARLRAN